MSPVEYLREFVNERLTAAAEEIFGVFEKTVVEYEAELSRQRRLLENICKPGLTLHGTELPQQHVYQEEEVLPDQPELCTQERNFSLDQEDPEPPQIKEEQEEEQLELKEETDTFMFTYEESGHSEDQTRYLNPDKTLSAAEEKSVVNIPVISFVLSEAHSDQQLLSHNFYVAESQNQKTGKHGDLGSTRDSVPEPQKKDHKSRIHCSNADNPNLSESHCNTHTDKQSFKCDTCGKDFKYNSLLQRHIKTHTGEKPYSCNVCGKGFSRTSTLNIHIRTHTVERPYSCNTCGKSFSQKSALNTHIKGHTGERPYLCNICGKGFSQTSALNIHIRGHTGEKPYLCNTCGKDFRRNDELKLHMRIHTGEKPFTCETCGRAFRVSRDLLVHMRRAHTGEKPYLCTVCGNRYFDVSQLTRHVRSHSDT
ncbi:zinc finger protein 239-like [Plectropomus leopardus]|uniref:zinc finger protein 239-like n=1 Tax=Plectropomus leopardus TaxID=160734 RepID=UPI001C4C1F62|nr:zinc finger protein 239-like [Plectropomus leopardus]